MTEHSVQFIHRIFPYRKTDSKQMVIFHLFKSSTPMLNWQLTSLRIANIFLAQTQKRLPANQRDHLQYRQ